MARFLFVSVCVVAALADCSNQEENCIAGSSLLATNAKPHHRTPPAPAPAPAEAAAAGGTSPLAIDTPGVETLKTLAIEEGAKSTKAKTSAGDMDVQQKASESSSNDASKKAEAAGEARVAHQSASEASKYAKELAAVASTARQSAINAETAATAAKTTFDNMATTEHTALTELHEEMSEFKKIDVDSSTKAMLAVSAKDDEAQANAKKQESQDKYTAATEAVFQAKRRKEKADEILTQATNLANAAKATHAAAENQTNDATALAATEMEKEKSNELALGDARTASAEADVKNDIAMGNLKDAREAFTTATAEANAKTEAAVEDESKAAESVVAAEMLERTAKKLADKVHDDPLAAGAFEGFSGGAPAEVNPVAEAIAVEDGV